MKIKIVNGVLIILVIAALLSLSILVRVGAKADTVAVLDVSGMTCGSCVVKIKKALQAEQGIASVDVDIDSGRAVVGYAADKIKPGAIAATVAGLGFTCRLVEVSSLAKFKSTHKDMAVGPERTSGCDCCNK
jgi:copper chaperone CopZ